LANWKKLNALSPKARAGIELRIPLMADEHMLTIFTTPKPFRGHIGTIQRNAIGSWLRLRPKCEVILFGDDPGSAEIAGELGLRHEPNIRRNEFDTPLLDSIFARAQQIATHDLLCYVNCDVVLLNCSCEAALRVARWSPKFLMVGQRRNTPVTKPLDFEQQDWESRLRAFAMRSGQEQPSYAIDYFAFPRGLYNDVPPLAIGRSYWDHWLVWKARSMKVPVVDSSAGVLAIHQKHDFSHHPGGFEGVRLGLEARRNRALAGGQLHLYTIEHATHQLVDGRIEDKPGRWHVPVTSLLHLYSSQLWYGFLKASFGVRHALGVHRRALTHVQRRVRSIIEE
jgi:hypothetical protein